MHLAGTGAGRAQLEGRTAEQVVSVAKVFYPAGTEGGEESQPVVGWRCVAIE